MIVSSFASMFAAGGLQVLPRPTDREIAQILAAVESGELVPVIDVQPLGGSPIVAVVTADYADRLIASEEADSLRDELRDAAAELSTLRTIIGEVMAEKEPADFAYRLEDAVDDVQAALDRAVDHAEDL